MSVAAAPAAEPRRRRARPVLPARLRAGLGLLALVLVAVLGRSGALDTPLWGDEGLSIGIAGHRLLDIPGVLAQDGSPPLYYLALHVWMSVAGQTETATHALSTLFAVACVPAAWWAARSLFGARAGWIAAVGAALNPFLTAYAAETRMYALVVLLSILVAAEFAHAFVFARRRHLPGFALALAALVYTHNWGIFVGIGAAVALAVLAAERPDRRALVRDGALGFGGAALLYVPWVPTLLGQARSTGAPWVTAPGPDALLHVWSILLGDDRAALAILLGGGVALGAALRRPAGPREAAVRSLVVLGVVTALVAWAASQASPAWTVRYTGALLGPLGLVAAAALASSGRRGLVAAAIVGLLWATSTNPGLRNKSNADDVATEVRARLHPADLVISTQPEQTALLHYYLPRGLRYATTLGPVPDPGVQDWRDALKRLRAARPSAQLEPLLGALRPGQQVLLVRPDTEVKARWSAPWTRLVRRRSAQWGDALATDGRLTRRALAPRFYRGAATVGVRALLYERR